MGHKKTKLLSKVASIWALSLVLLPFIGASVAHASAGGYLASGIFGQANFTQDVSGTSASLTTYPSSTAIDSVHHRLFVAEYGNDYIKVYRLGNHDQKVTNKASNVIGSNNLSVGGNGSITTRSNFNFLPASIAYDSINNRLFVMDFYRVLVFNLAHGITNGMNASYVLGQANFTQTVTGYNKNNLNQPGGYGGGLAFDPSNERLFVGDAARVLVFNVSPSFLHNDENASNVIGQPNFSSSTATCTRTGMKGGDDTYDMESLALDSVNQRLFVANSLCNRILDYNVSPSAIHNGENALNVLGQANFTANDAASTTNASTFLHLQGISYDSNNKRLFVQDEWGERILVFNVNPSAIKNGESATGVLGQPDFATLNEAVTRDGLDCNYYGATNFAYDTTTDVLFYPDECAHRILLYNFVSMLNAMTGRLTSGSINGHYHQQLRSNNGQGHITYKVTGGALPPGLKLSASGLISGTPNEAGTFDFEVSVYDNNGAFGTFVNDPAFSITIDGPGGPNTGFGQPSSYSLGSLLAGTAVFTILLGLALKLRKPLSK